MSGPMTMGVDAGSRQVKIVIGAGRQITFNAMIDTVQFYLTCRDGGGDSRDIVSSRVIDITRLAQLTGAPRWTRVVSTGYGRNNVAVAGGRAIPEIMAHAAGAVSQTGLNEFTLVDLGGQDTKVISVRNGMVDDFVMNDKCAAGSGRYLENIAMALGASLDMLGQCWHDPVKLSNTCAIFGESEVVGLVSDGASVESILAGANSSVVARLTPMIRRYRPKVIVATGGVAKNMAVRKLLEMETGVEVITPAEPQLNGAIGCVMA
ncbi:MAG: acyl-CoA dehydratase activase [Nitrospinota bacterium]|nr:acyl-CoA dehydratase activase [Nitrospinota bacterium]